MKIAIVGPSHPYKGGIVQETTELAHRMRDAGHEVELVSWKSQFPAKLYPGSLLPIDQPELPPFENTSHRLHWSDPLSWRSTGKRLRSFDLVIFVWWVPTFHGPIYSTIMHYLNGVRTAVICHNVLPHEGRPGDRFFATHFFRRVDHLIVHTDEQAETAKALTPKIISTTALPPLLPGWSNAASAHDAAVHKRLLFFGIVRDYKGLDVLLRALALVPSVKLTVAGEFWGGTDEYDNLIAELGIATRVDMHAGYISSEAIPELFHAADALVLPYRSATGTTNVRLGFAYNVPVIASDVDTLADQIQDGTDGFVFKNGDEKSLASAIEQLYAPGTLAHVQSHLPAVEVDSVWQNYIEILTRSV